MARTRAAALLLLSALPVFSHAAKDSQDPLLRAMAAELNRSFNALRSAGPAPMYFLAYEARDTRTYAISALLGALRSEDEHSFRELDVDVRVGAPRLDNTHQMKGEDAWPEPADLRNDARLTIAGDEDAIRADLWLRTDEAFKNAQNRLTKVLTNKAVTAEEEDPSDDFSPAEARRHYAPAGFPDFDRSLWRDRVVSLSSAMRTLPFLLESDVSLSVRTENRYITTSQGAEIVEGATFLRLSYTLTARTGDGMDLDRSKSYDASEFSGLPGQDEVLRDIRESASQLKALLSAPIVEPYAGPAVFRNLAAAVFFHEILGHRLEGHRQKLEDEGQTFAKMIGKPVTAGILTLIDDPTRKEHRGVFLRGHYAYDDEGVRAEPVVLVKDGILRGFLMSRSPIRAFPRSNGHGRRSAGAPVVARMANTIVEAEGAVSYPELRERLLEEIRRQGKPYGLVFEDIAGGFTNTTRDAAQSFKVLPRLVYRVYADGRPDEIVRGVDIVGTPLNSLTGILAAADDYAVFNGTCGAESGWVPVSSVSPSILVSEVEIEKNMKASRRPPLLAPPLHDEEAVR